MQRTQRTYPAIWFFLAVLFLLKQPIPAFSQTTDAREGFLLNVNLPFLYATFDHIGPGAPRTKDEPKQRVWLRLINNCRIPIAVRANGVPDESPKNEVGVEYDVVANRAILAIFTGKPENKNMTVQQKPQASTTDLPRGYMEEVASLATIEPGSEILFSLPVNHLSDKWHIEIPFEFEVPKGKGPRDPVNGGTPVMVLQYYLWDLPPKSRADIGKN